MLLYWRADTDRKNRRNRGRGWPLYFHIHPRIPFVSVITRVHDLHPEISGD
jgi:hypothetical protein